MVDGAQSIDRLGPRICTQSDASIRDVHGLNPFLVYLGATRVDAGVHNIAHQMPRTSETLGVSSKGASTSPHLVCREWINGLGGARRTNPKEPRM